MLTCPPGPDVAPTHDRQVAVLRQSDWKAWLDCSAPAGELIRTLPGGSLGARRAPLTLHSPFNSNPFMRVPRDA